MITPRSPDQLDSAHAIADGAEMLAQRLIPVDALAGRPGRAQSLATGAAGIALLHIERAHAGTTSWRTVHEWVQAATAGEISADDNAGLYFGVPAISFILHAAGTDGRRRYGAALAGLDSHVAALAHRRVDLALRRIRTSHRPPFAEYDLLHGLTGIGALLLVHDPGNDALGRILDYLVCLAQPLHVDGQTLPGWWASHDPWVKNSPGFPGGHANLGIAHGISGPLALLAQATRAGIIVDGHDEAIGGIGAFMDSWRQDTDDGVWWPQWLTHHNLRTGRTGQPSPARPSWCYGTPGIARARQLAAIAAGDPSQQKAAEHALFTCLSDPAQLVQVIDTSLCHGWAGIVQTVFHASRDALTPRLSVLLPNLIYRLADQATGRDNSDNGLLEGAAGAALALHTATRAMPPISGWDTCLMIN